MAANGSRPLSIALELRGAGFFRDVALGIVPAAYMLGFVGRARYSAEMGLGWRSATADQYLAVGAALTVVTTTTLASLVIGASRWHGRAGRVWPWRLLGSALAIVAAIPMFLIAMLFLDVVGALTTSRFTILVFATAAVIGVFVAEVGALLLDSSTRAIRRANDWLPQDGNFRLGIPLAASLLAVLAISPMVLSTFDADYANITERTAVLWIAPESWDELPVELQADRPSEGTAYRTVPVALWSAQDSYLVRVDAAGADSALYHVSKAVVNGVTWYD